MLCERLHKLSYCSSCLTLPLLNFTFAYLPSFLIDSNSKDSSGGQKLSKGGIPLANGDALLHRPPPWAFPLRTAQDAYRNSADRLSSSTAQAIDQVMAHKSDARVKLVHLSLSVEKLKRQASGSTNGTDGTLEEVDKSGLDWVRVVLTADPGGTMEESEDQGLSRRKEHRRVPSMVAMEEVKVMALINCFLFLGKLYGRVYVCQYLDLFLLPIRRL